MAAPVIVPANLAPAFRTDSRRNGGNNFTVTTHADQTDAEGKATSVLFLARDEQGKAVGIARTKDMNKVGDARQRFLLKMDKFMLDYEPTQA